MHIQQIAIGESFNPSAVTEVFSYDEDDNEHLMFTLNPKRIPLESRMLNIFIDRTTYKVKAIKIVVDGSLVEGYNSIDAIGITDSKVPIRAQINISPDVRTDIIPERLSDKINSEYKDLRPLISPDGKTLFFSRRNHPENIGGIEDKEDIWYSKLDTLTGEWMEARNLGADLNNKGPNYINSIAEDGNTLLLLLGNEYLGGDKMIAGASVSEQKGNGWTKPEGLDIMNDYNFSPKANYFLTFDRKRIIMSVERDDSYGERDLYMTEMMENGRWKEPINIGPDVNTASEAFWTIFGC